MQSLADDRADFIGVDGAGERAMGVRSKPIEGECASLLIRDDNDEGFDRLFGQLIEQRKTL
jgi:hypothetical protein